MTASNNNTSANPDFIMIKDVRCSFPHLFEKPIINGQEGKCGAALMLEPGKHANAIAQIKKAIQALATERLKGRVPPSDKLCLRPGEDKGRPEYDGHVILSANSRTRPAVVSHFGSGTITDPQQNAIYGGCYVNAKVRLWAQDNNFGKRINCELVAIQFCRDGEPLDGMHVSEEQAVEGFDVPNDEFGGEIDPLAA